jgi:maltose alpha-D-glucosyltransferase/alpha-amylase
MLFDTNVSEKFPSMNMKLTLYNDQFEDDVNMKKVQNLIEAGLYSDRYKLSINQLGKGNTTNLLFLLTISNLRNPDQPPVSYVLKSYKDYSVSLEPSTLFVLVKNKFPNAPKIYGTIKLLDKETIGIIESVPNIGNLGEIYWNELNDMINTVFRDVNNDYSKFTEKQIISNLIKDYCTETIKLSSDIGQYIKKLHQSLILSDKEEFSLESVDSNVYLRNYTENLNSIIDELLSHMTQQSESAFFNLPKISSILIDIKDVIESFRTEFQTSNIDIQPVHQDLHMEQILYNKVANQYQFYFIDFEGDPQLSIGERKGKFPLEKDLASFLRALSYIKFNTLLSYIEKSIIRKDKYKVPEEILYNLYFRRAARPINKTLDIILNVLNIWEKKLMNKILMNSNLDYILITYFYIERALYELRYEIGHRPNKILVPILGLKEIVDKS